MITLILAIALIIMNSLLISKMPVILFQYTYDNLNEIIDARYYDLSTAERLLVSQEDFREQVEKAKNLKSASITLTIFLIVISLVLIYIAYKLENKNIIKRSEKPYHQKVTFISQNIENDILQLNIDISNIANGTKFFYVEDFTIEIENIKNQINYFLDKNMQKRSLPVNIHRVIKLCIPLKTNLDLKTMHIYYKGHELELGKDLKIKNDEIIN